MRQHPSQSPADRDHTHPRAQPNSVEVGALHSSVYGVVGNITAIDPDDAASAGTLATVARSDHGHEFLTATASALTKTATNTEGSSGDGARADHGHATDALPWGKIARQTPLTVDYSTSVSATTDHAISGVVTDSTRLYVVHLQDMWFLDAAGSWVLNFHADGTLQFQIGFIQVQAAESNEWHMAKEWTPASDTFDLDIRVVENSGASTLTLVGTSTRTRHFWVEDIGPRT